MRGLSPSLLRVGVWRIPLSREFFLNFQLKMEGLCIFIAENYLWPETVTGGLIDPLGAEDVKHTGGENLAGGLTPQSSVISHPDIGSKRLTNHNDYRAIK